MFPPSPDKLVSSGDVDGDTEQQHPFQPGEYSLVQRERVLLGDVQDFQAVQTDGPCAVQPAGLPALPRGGFAGQPDSAAVGRLPQYADVSSGPGLGEQPHH